MTGVVEIDEFGIYHVERSEATSVLLLDGQHCCQELGIHGWHFEHPLLAGLNRLVLMLL